MGCAGAGAAGDITGTSAETHLPTIRPRPPAATHPAGLSATVPQRSAASETARPASRNPTTPFLTGSLCPFYLFFEGALLDSKNPAAVYEPFEPTDGPNVTESLHLTQVI